MNVKNVIMISDYTYVEGGAAKVAIDTANLLAQKVNCIFISPSYKNKSILSEKVLLYTSEQGDCISNSNKIKGLKNGIRNKKFANLVKKVLDMYNPENTIVNIHGWTKACSAYFMKYVKQKKIVTYVTSHDYFLICANGGLYNYKKQKSCNLNPGSFKCKICNCDSRSYFFKIYRNLRIKSYKKYFSNYVKVICVSEFQKEILVKKIKNEIVVLHNPLKILVGLEKVEKKYDYVFIGRTSKEKGFDLFEKLSHDFPEKTFLLVGTTNEKKNQDNMQITGWVDEYSVEKYLKQSRCMIFPSRWPETYGLNVKKALRYNVQCIVSSNTYASTINDKRVFIFKQGDYESLKEIVENVKLDCPREIKFEEKKDYISDLLQIFEMR